MTDLNLFILHILNDVLYWLMMTLCRNQEWVSFGKQKKIAQFWFETVPQVSVQTLLFFGIINGKKVSGITDRDLLLSVSFAAANSLFSVFELFAESRGVSESFVQYSLHCITARHGWVPFEDIISGFLGGNVGGNGNRGSSCCEQLCGLKAIPKDRDRQKANDNELHIDYNMKYRLPFLSWLSGEKLTVTITYSFSPLTLKSLMAILQTKKESASDAKSPSGSFTPSRRKLTAERKTLSIKFRKSLDLLSVRQIVHLMQCCHSQGIKLPDIHEVDWQQIFQNTPIDEDPRLYSNTFDEDSRPLLISLYLTNYDNNNWQILRDFIALDADINVADDNGSTLLHHMLKRNDWRAIKVLFSALKWNQRINFDLENDERNIVILEMVKMYKVKGLKEVLNALKPRQQINFAVSDQSGDTIFHHLARSEDVDVLRNVLRMIQSHYSDRDKLNLSVSNNNDESIIALALMNDAKQLTKVDQELVLDLPDIEQEDEDDDDDDNVVEDGDKKSSDDRQEDVDSMANSSDSTEITNAENEPKANLQSAEEVEQQLTTGTLRQFEGQWERFQESWLYIQTQSILLDPRVLVNALYLKANQMTAALPQSMDFQDRLSKIKWLNRQIKAILKNIDLKASVREILSAEISTERHHEEAINNAILNGFKTQYEFDDLESGMMHRVLLKHDDIVLYNHRYPQRSVLGFVLVRYSPFYEYFEIVHRLLTNSNIKLMTHEIPIFVKLYEDAAAKAYSSAYFALFEKVYSVSSLSDSVQIVCILLHGF